jgi:hypothetical protein
MRTVFPEWADTALRLGLAGLVALGAAAVLAPLIYVRTPYAEDRGYPVEQPVQFDHRHHVRDDGIDCRYCHSDVGRGRSAGVPPTETCMGCHNQVWPDSPLLAPVRQSFFSGTPIAWSRVHRLPGYVYFDHAIHVHKGVGCVECHGRVDQMALVYQVAPLTMGWCLDCHRDPAPHLRPPSEVTRMEWQPPAGIDRVTYGRALAGELGVRSVTHCSACHR